VGWWQEDGMPRAGLGNRHSKTREIE